MLERTPISRRKLLKLSLLAGASALVGSIGGTLATLELNKDEASPDVKTPREQFVDTYDQIFNELKERNSSIILDFDEAAEELAAKGFEPRLIAMTGSGLFSFSPDPESYPIYILQTNQQLKFLTILDRHPLESYFANYVITENQIVEDKTSWVTFPEQSNFYNYSMRLMNTKDVKSLTLKLQSDFANWLEKQIA